MKNSLIFFTLREYDYIINKDLNNQLSKFYEIWTLKESYIKCCGKGLSIPLHSFSINMDQYEYLKVIVNNQFKDNILKILDILPGYEIAVCSLNDKVTNNIVNIDQNNLISSYFKLVIE